MRRTCLRNEFIDSKTDANRTTLLLCKSDKKRKKGYYSNLKIRDVADNKTFWGKVKSFFRKSKFTKKTC